jgi:hypothetical protein
MYVERLCHIESRYKAQMDDCKQYENQIASLRLELDNNRKIGEQLKQEKEVNLATIDRLAEDIQRISDGAGTIIEDVNVSQTDIADCGAHSHGCLAAELLRAMSSSTQNEIGVQTDQDRTAKIAPYDGRVWRSSVGMGIFVLVLLVSTVALNKLLHGELCYREWVSSNSYERGLREGFYINGRGCDVPYLPLT